MSKQKVAPMPLWHLMKFANPHLEKADCKRLCKQGRVKLDEKVIRNIELPVMPRTRIQIDFPK